MPSTFTVSAPIRSATVQIRLGRSALRAVARGGGVVFVCPEPPEPAPGKMVRAVEDKLVKRIPAHYMRDAHHWLILHGRYVCKARKPDCPSCIVSDLCAYKSKTTKE